MPFLIDKTYIEDKFQAYIQSKVKPLGYECVIEPYDGPTYQQFVGILVSQELSVVGGLVPESLTAYLISLSVIVTLVPFEPLVP